MTRSGSKEESRARVGSAKNRLFRAEGVGGRGTAELCRRRARNMASGVKLRQGVCKRMSGSPKVSRWLARTTANRSARLRLFCFPYAGAGASVFNSWVDHLSLEVELCAVQLPGRESRYSEPFCVDLALLVQSLIPVLQPFTDIPFAFFGHSMGGLISFELARECRRQHQQGPVHLIVSGCRAPQLPDPHPPISGELDPAFIAHLRQYGGTTETVLENNELMEVLLPLLRADFAMCEAYSYSREEPLNCSVSAFGGKEDRRVSVEELSAWQFQTSGSFELHTFPGQHFYIHYSQLPFLNALSRDLAKLTEASTLPR